LIARARGDRDEAGRPRPGFDIPAAEHGDLD